MTPDHKALCDRLQWLLDQDPKSKVFDVRAETLAEIIAAIATLSAREAALIDTIARLTAERDAVQAVTVDACIAAIQGSALLDDTKEPEDEAYMQGLSEAIAAIRALAQDNTP